MVILDFPAATMLCSAARKVRGRFSDTRCGPSRRCARNASEPLENFACYPQKTFSTASVKAGLRRSVWATSALRQIGPLSAGTPRGPFGANRGRVRRQVYLLTHARWRRAREARYG